MGYDKATPAQQVYIERAARLKVLVEALYEVWEKNGFETGGGKEYFSAEKQYGEALKAAGINPLDEGDDPPPRPGAGSKLVQ